MVEIDGRAAKTDRKTTDTEGMTAKVDGRTAEINRRTAKTEEITTKVDGIPEDKGRRATETHKATTKVNGTVDETEEIVETDEVGAPLVGLKAGTARATANTNERTTR